METQGFKDSVEFNRGFVFSIPVEDSEEIGDAARDGKNCGFSAYGRVRSWPGVSIINEIGAPHLMLVGDKLAGLDAGTVLLAAGGSVWFVGAGDVFVDDFSTPIGSATSLLQFRYKGVTYQAALPAPPAPVLRLAADSLGSPLPGQMNGRRAIGLTRRRSGVGTESPLSLLSNVVQLSGHRLSVELPAALTGLGQDAWGLYATREGFEGATPLLLRVVQETEVAPVLAAALASVNATGTSYSATSSTATAGRVSLVVLSPSGVSPVTFRESTSSRSAGSDTRVRFQRTAAAAAGDWLVAALTVKQAHAISPGASNKGTVTITNVFGAWSAAATGGELIDVEVISATQFRWKLRSVGTWTTDSISNTPIALGATGLAVKWSAAIATITEVGDTFTISPLSLIAPADWTLHHVVSSVSDDFALVVFSKQTAIAEPDTYDFTTDKPTQIFGTMLAAAEAGGVSDVAAAATASGTTHGASLGTAPTVNHLVVANFAGGAGVTFTATAPLVPRVATVAGSRRLELDFTDNDLLEVLAPVGVESPPAATHAFLLGQIMVLAGTLDGTAINPSQPNQFEQYDLANTAYLNPTESIIRVDSRPLEGSVYIWTRNSLQVPVFTGDDDFPILPRAVWPHTGIQNKNAACLTPRGAYAFTVNGPVRSNGTEVPDSAFALPVLDYMRPWRPDRVVVGHDESEGGMAVFCHEREILVFYETTGLWSLPLNIDDFYYYVRRVVNDGAIAAISRSLTSASNRWRAENVGEFITVSGAGDSGSDLNTIIDEVIAPGQIQLRDAAATAVSGATVSWGADATQSRVVAACSKEGRLYLAIGDEAYSQLYKFNVGAGTVWNVRGGPRNGGAIGQQKTVRSAKLLANFDSIMTVHYDRRVNLTEGAGRLTLTGGATGYALGDLFVTTNSMHGTSVYWEWRLEVSKKPRGVLLDKASALNFRTGSLAAAAWGGGLAGWRVTDMGELQVSFGGATDPGFGGVVADGDVIRLVLTSEGWQAYWLDSGYTQKDYAEVAFATSLLEVVNEPVGVKVFIDSIGGSVECGRVGRGDTNAGCLRLYDDYAATVPVAEWFFDAMGLKEYDWEKANFKCPIFSVEACGVGAEQSPARVLVDGRYVPGHKKY